METPKYKEISIGIDPSYSRTGVSICGDGKLLKVGSIPLSKLSNNSAKRTKLSQFLGRLLTMVVPKGEKVVCVIERARIHGGPTSFINLDAIKAIGALTATVVDQCAIYDVPVFSVDTRCWKSQVVGTSKGGKNAFGVPEEKWPTIRWICDQGFRDSILEEVSGRRVNGTFVHKGKKYTFDNDGADSGAIAMFWFVGDKTKLKEEH